MVQNERTSQVLPITSLRPKADARSIVLTADEWRQLELIALKRTQESNGRFVWTPEQCLHDMIAASALKAPALA